MTKKHYVAIAEIIRRFYFGTPSTDQKQLAEMFADYFQTENKQFDRARFLTACGIRTRKGTLMQGWNVYLSGRLIDTVFYDSVYDSGCSKDYVLRGLIEHDGYDPRITIRRA